MLKSTKKEVLNKIRAYIIDNTAPEVEEAKEWQELPQAITEAGIYAECCYYIIETWKAGRNPRPSNMHDNFAEWLSGLPLNISEHFYKPAKPIVMEWLQETEEEAERFTETQAEDYISHLLYREITKEAIKRGIRF